MANLEFVLLATCNLREQACQETATKWSTSAAQSPTSTSRSRFTSGKRKIKDTRAGACHFDAHYEQHRESRTMTDPLISIRFTGGGLCTISSTSSCPVFSSPRWRCSASRCRQIRGRSSPWVSQSGTPVCCALDALSKTVKLIQKLHQLFIPPDVFFKHSSFVSHHVSAKQRDSAR